ncbi:Tetratricopeptide repeat-containing protein [Reichenbachiella faecimaris]|uniref:Tetratricopeptide repeat-containing protein n=1 Tax=Reichenbachiella faecimaris TaxID=692418 RepID=A0A1W2G925_REIFA|nr:tetratricopeptide repeat protein [Reichenbachiella faecimaris]SMD33185.1 Tetratricopeptide repeat-containing protein [Reichenbachiella faecimaris]
MRRLITLVLTCIFCQHLAHPQSEVPLPDTIKLSKHELISWLDSSSHTLSETSLPDYIETIENHLDSLSRDQTIRYLQTALTYSVEQKLSNPKIHYLISEEYYSKLSYDTASYHVDQLLELYDQANPRHLALALEIKASGLLRTEKFENLKKLLDEHREFLISQFPHNYLYIFNLLLYSYMVTSRYDDVIMESQDALQLAQETEDHVNVILLQNKMAAAHKNNKNYDIARSYLLKSLQIVKEHPNPHSESYIQYDLGLLYRDMGDLDSAIVHVKKALSLMAPQARNNYSVQLATYYADNGQFSEAKQILDSIDMTILIDETARGEILYARGISKAGFGNYQSAIADLDSALIIRSESPREVVRIKLALSRLKQLTGESEEALILYKQADTIEDSLFSLEKQEVIARLESQFQLSEKEKEILRLEAEAVQGRNLLLSSIGLGFLLAIIAFLAIRSYQLKREANEELSKKNQHLKALREKEKQLAEATIHAKERELATMAMAAHEKNSLLQDLEQKVNFLEKKLSDELTPDFRDLKKTIANGYSIDNSWENFHNHFQDVHPLFFENLKQINPGLTNDDLKLSAYLKIGMSNKEIAGVIHLTVGSVKTKVNRLKKKLEMGPHDNLRNFMFNNN